MQGDNVGETPPHRFEPTLILELDAAFEPVVPNATDDLASVPLDRSGDTFDWSLYAIPTDQYFVILPTNDAGSSNRTERSVVDRLATMFMEELKNFVQGTPRSFALGPAC